MDSLIGEIVPVALAAGAKFIDKVKFLRKVKDIVEEMKMETQRIHNFLEDDDDHTSNEQSQQQHKSREFRQRVSEIREAVLDAEDTVDNYMAQLALMERDLRIKKWARIALNIKYINDVGSEIEAQNSKISTLKSEIQKLRPSSSSGGSTKSSQRRSYGHIHERNTVGLEDNIEEVVALVKEKKCKLVSIYGMGGVGKTTLAKKVFNHKEVKKHFDRFAWVYVSQHVKERDVWESALVGLTSPSPEEQKCFQDLTDEQLVAKLSQVQNDHKCLTVLDDVWEIGDWDKLRAGFSIDDKSLSRILFTTRNKKFVAEDVNYSRSYGGLKPLSDDRSLELLRNIALHNGRDEFADKKSLENLGRKMLKHCKGLPLAITVLGGILATKDTLRDWQTVHDNVNAYLRRGKGHNDKQGLGVQHVLAYSYYELPPQLKTCFLYFSIFPKEYDIPTRKLMKMWMVEGFLCVTDDRVGEETMEDVAERYLNELVSRCVVEVGNKASTGRIKKCHLHELMHDLCLSKANEENFIHNHNNNLQREGKGKLRRIGSIGDTSMNTKISLSSYESHSHIRSLMLFYNYDNFRLRAKLEPVQLADSFKFLRILLLERIEMQHLKGFSKQIEELVLLRYLSLRRSLIRSFPSLDKLEFMETLDLRVKKVKKKNVLRGSEIWRMKQLRHLFLPKIMYEYSIDGGENVQNSTPNLQTLGNFPPPNCKLGKLLDFPKLRKLQVLQGNHGQEFWEMLNTDEEFIFNSLYSLTVVAKGHDDKIFEKYVALEAVLERCPHLYKLKVVGPINKFPHLNQFPKSLSNLIMKHSQIHDPDPIQTILGKLPNLITLLLGNDSLLGKQLFFGKGTFPQLKSLRLEKFELSDLRVEEGAMPKLESLVINKVRELVTVPEAFGLIATLNELEIRSMPAEFAARLKEGGADFNKFKHVPSITFDRCD